MSDYSPEQMMSAIRGAIEDSINTVADNIIEQKVLEFRKQLEREKNQAVTGILNAVTIKTHYDEMSLRTVVDIHYRPEIVVRR